MNEARSRLAHLWRRAGFGARPEELDASEAAGYEATVERLLDLSAPDPAADAVGLPSFTPNLAPGALPADETARRAVIAANLVAKSHDGVRLLGWWPDRMAAAAVPLREKLTLFWHGHFATSMAKVQEPELLFRQNQLFRAAGGRSFEALTQAVARDPAMLQWLDANANERSSPNENFARELMELFTLGVGRYGEADVKAGARAFAGWRAEYPAYAFHVDPLRADGGPKTVLGHSGNLAGDDVVRLACSSADCARFVAAKVWSRFARPAAPDDPVVGELARGFAADLDVTRLLRAVFLHPEFSAPATRTGLVKQPLEWVAGALRALGVRTAAVPDLVTHLTALGQVPFYPPTVAGWPQNGYWLNASTSLARLRFAWAAAAVADLSVVAAAPPWNRPAVAAHQLSVDWGPATRAALASVAHDPPALVALALVAPEYVLA